MNREGIWDIISKGIPPYVDPAYRPPPRPPDLQNVNRESIWVFGRESSPYAEAVYRPPPKP